MQGKDMEELLEEVKQIRKIVEKMGHMIDSQSHCPMCGEPADGTCPACSFDPRN
jgi:rubrerythrin